MDANTARNGQVHENRNPSENARSRPEAVRITTRLGLAAAYQRHREYHERAARLKAVTGHDMPQRDLDWKILAARYGYDGPFSEDAIYAHVLAQFADTPATPASLPQDEDSAPECYRRARESYLWVCSEHPEMIPSGKSKISKRQWECIKASDECPSYQGGYIPDYRTWRRYLRRAPARDTGNVWGRQKTGGLLPGAEIPAPDVPYTRLDQNGGYIDSAGKYRLPRCRGLKQG
jgi:hypothetical protein